MMLAKATPASALPTRPLLAPPNTFWVQIVNLNKLTVSIPWVTSACIQKCRNSIANIFHGLCIFCR